MTLAAMARQLNTTTMTIYRRLKRKGVDIASLRDDVSGELTPAGMSIIASLFDGQGATTLEQGAGHDAEQVITGDAEQGATLYTQVCVLQARLDGAEALIEQLTNERDDLRRQLAAALAALATEQADRQQERLLLTDGQQRRRGLFGWIRRDKGE